MPSLHATVSTLCAAYFAVSIVVVSIVLQAMWDSFFNTPVGVCVLDAEGSECFRDTRSTVSVLSTATPDKAIVCSAVAKDDMFAALVATSASFTAAFQDGARLLLCNDDGSVCLSFAQEEDLKRFLSAVEIE